MRRRFNWYFNLTEEGFDVSGLSPCPRTTARELRCFAESTRATLPIPTLYWESPSLTVDGGSSGKSLRVTPYEHNTVQDATLNSVFTSWTINPLVAENYALRDQNIGRALSSGVVLEAQISMSRTFPSPDAPITLIPGRRVTARST